MLRFTVANSLFVLDQSELHLYQFFCSRASNVILSSSPNFGIYRNSWMAG